MRFRLSYEYEEIKVKTFNNYFLSAFIAANDKPRNATLPTASPTAPRVVRKPPVEQEIGVEDED